MKVNIILQEILCGELFTAYCAPLRVGNTDLGTLWLLTDEVNLTVLCPILKQVSLHFLSRKIQAINNETEKQADVFITNGCFIA